LPCKTAIKNISRFSTNSFEKFEKVLKNHLTKGKRSDIIDRLSHGSVGD